ncbi:MAG: serine/threonine protein kinase, partial [Actinomycetota bacterium]|nr:serine/threonine protein kinase [Actinomycetota bacterium]
MADQTSGNRSQAPGYLVAGRYRLISRISRGGMGAVWLARDDLLGREVALKQVLPQPGADATQAGEQRERSLREGRIAARLTHPHVIAMYDVALDGGEPWLVMEYLPSQSLAAVLKARGPLPAAEVARIGAQLSDALAAAHQVGIVHRDVKPGNVLIAEGGDGSQTVKITDFGISHAYGDVTLTQTGILHGTPAYLAPEVARGGDPTPASDVFSLGATLFTAVEGSPPFGFGDNTIALLHRVARGEVTSPQRAGPMTTTLLHMLEPNPEHRLTMSQARNELTTSRMGVHGYPATAQIPSPVPDTVQRTRVAPGFAAPSAGRRRPLAGWIAAGVVAILLLVVAVVS